MYEKPDFYVTEFVANEYITMCNRVENEIISLKCSCGAEISSSVSSTSTSNARINLTDGSVIYLNAESDSDRLLVFRTATSQSGGTVSGCATSGYAAGDTFYPGAGSTGDNCKVYGDSGVLESTPHHHATVSSVSNFS